MADTEGKKDNSGCCGRDTDVSVKPILVTRASMPGFEEYIEEIRPLWESRFITNMGVLHEELKEALKKKLEAAGLELFVNGHLALEMILQAFRLQGEVITTPFTFASTVHAIVRNGLKPVMCDVREEDGTLDPDCLEKLLTPRTCAIVPVHVYGNICDDEGIGRFAAEHGLKVIYDAAHAFGEWILKPDGSRISAASLGDASMFSFHATKVFNTIEGGAVTWNPEKYPELEKILYDIKNFGITGKESVEYVGGNAKLNEFSAAMGLCNLRHVDHWIKERRRVSERYEAQLKAIPGLRLFERRGDVSGNYAYMPVLFEASETLRNQVYEELVHREIFARKYFYPLVSDFACYKDTMDSGRTPVAAALSQQVLCLPVYPELENGEIDRICGLLETLV